MTEAWHLPFAAHDCTGPVALTASAHLALSAPNVFIQEVVRAFYFGWYREPVTDLPPIEEGQIRAPKGPASAPASCPRCRNAPTPGSG